MAVDVSDLNQLAVTFDVAAGRQGARAVVALRKVAADVEATAKVFAPVDTGNLRNSIGTDFDAGVTYAEAVIGPTASYGAYVEYGTARQAPAAFMGPAFDRHAYELPAALASIAADLL